MSSSIRILIIAMATATGVSGQLVERFPPGSPGVPQVPPDGPLPDQAANWLDRVTLGSVVDFLNVGVGPVRTGVFNVADVAIMLGAGVIVIATFGKKPARPPGARAGGTA